MRSVIILLLLMVSIACTKRAVEPTRQSRHTIDTVFQQKSIAMQPMMDAYCDSLFNQVYDIAVDSIMAQRKAEMNILVQ